MTEYVGCSSAVSTKQNKKNPTLLEPAQTSVNTFLCYDAFPTNASESFRTRQTMRTLRYFDLSECQ